MPEIKDYSIYLASWEHLYLLPNGVPAGLPNQLFSRHPWILILFEKLYCDENGLKGEQNAAEQLKWTNSKLFVKLASTKYDIIQPLNLKTPLYPFIGDLKKEFKKENGISIDKAIENNNISVEELFKWRIKLITPYLNEKKLILYDWPVAQYGLSIPVSLQVAVRDAFNLQVAALPLSKDVNSELSSERSKIFKDLQNFEFQPLMDLRSGRLPQPDYLKLLLQRAKDYREVDMELTDGIDIKLDNIIKLRERFGKRGGWKLVQEYLLLYDREYDPQELLEKQKELECKLKEVFKPSIREFGPITWSITKGIVNCVISLLPVIGQVKTSVDTFNEIKSPVHQLNSLVSDTIHFFRGNSRNIHKNK